MQNQMSSFTCCWWLVTQKNVVVQVDKQPGVHSPAPRCLSKSPEEEARAERKVGASRAEMGTRRLTSARSPLARYKHGADVTASVCKVSVWWHVYRQHITADMWDANGETWHLTWSFPVPGYYRLAAHWMQPGCTLGFFAVERATCIH